tara:strand:- start:7389 stop:7883 length:495 start_codon:yes stop_codon:yes gene_type:complete
MKIYGFDCKLERTHIIILVIILIIYLNLFSTTFGSFKEGILTLEKIVYFLVNLFNKLITILNTSFENFELENYQNENYKNENFKINDNNNFFRNTHYDKLEQHSYGNKVPFPSSNDKLDILVNNEFTPECCPSSYTNSTGCACMTSEQINFLNTRGGNSDGFSL